MQDEQKHLTDDLRRQTEQAAATAVWADDGGQHRAGPYAGGVLAVNRDSGMPRRARAGTTLPPLMSTLRATQHQFDRLLLPWSWCRCCQRAFVKGTFRRRRIAATARRPRSRIVQECPYQNCWGQILRDSRPWSSIRQAHPSYPEHPERYVVYAHQSGVRI